MKAHNIIIALLVLVVLVGGVYIYTLEKYNVVIPRSQIRDDVEIPFQPEVLTATTADATLPPVYQATTSQAGKIDEHLTIDNTLRDVNFCGNTYKVKQIMIDGVDVIQRIAEIATNNVISKDLKAGPFKLGTDKQESLNMKEGELAGGICDSIKNNTTDGIIGVNYVKKINTVDHTGVNQDVYVIWLVPVSYENAFGIAPATNNIYGVSGYDGSLYGPIGKLK
jgi:hypothetical protein